VTVPRRWDDLAAALSVAQTGPVERDAPLGALTTWRVGGPAAVLVRVQSIDDLVAVGRTLVSDPHFAVPSLVLGRGSNLLVADAGFAGVVIALGPAFESVVIGTDEVTAGGATPLPVLARQCASAGRGGLGFYVGIPGSVGGAVRMNAGGHGRETAEVLLEATIVDLAAEGRTVVAPTAALDLGYRHSSVRDDQVVVAAKYRVEASDPELLRTELSEIVRWRAEHQPGGANAGSVFRNPPNDSAGRLIDVECGLRGLHIGGASVSDKHANFIQADAGATATQVHQLITLVRDRVQDTTGVRLEPEVHQVGFPDPELDET
jgi:UDP-N-acetylmuramate dehydrogenase